MPRLLHPEQLRRPWAVWWAVLLAVWFATGPTLSQELAFASGDPRFEICTAQGARALAPDRTQSGQSSNGQESTPALSHCPWCLHAADRLAPAPTPCVYPVMASGERQDGPAWRTWFHTDNTRFWTPPRGPPAA